MTNCAVTIPDSVTSVGVEAFLWCTSLTSPFWSTVASTTLNASGTP
ncbi:MAG: hypothetical protein PHU80_04310 [Kiritimatiellae bacterium]|nr:hypothetical protein [Kiritimatiellia bacterium]